MTLFDGLLPEDVRYTRLKLSYNIFTVFMIVISNFDKAILIDSEVTAFLGRTDF